MWYEYLIDILYFFNIANKICRHWTCKYLYNILDLVNHFIAIHNSVINSSTVTIQVLLL